MSEERLERDRNKKMRLSADTPSASSQSPVAAIAGTSNSANTTPNASRQAVRPTNSVNTNNTTNSNATNSNSVNNNSNERQNGDRDREVNKDIKMNPKMSKALSTSAKRYPFFSIYTLSIYCLMIC